ncbi:MAG: flocculation-associated PEP-CTERM protein PepA [Simplicispira sp.]|nr:flocculation-associated PEP-CTERM protein PepA [Simplicispira sp.]
MKFAKLIKGFSTASVLAMSLGLSSVASAAPTFQVTPSVLGGPATAFNADQMGGFMSSLITYNPADNTTYGEGYISFSGFALNNQNVLPVVSGLGSNYDLYVTYNFTTDVTGVFGVPGSEDTITSLNYELWGAEGAGTTTLTVADASSNQAASATNAGAKKIGFGSLLEGITGFNTQGGAFVNLSASYANTTFGDTFFTAPFPFYDLAFTSFNNTIQGIEIAGNVVSVNQAVGNIDFNRNEVPEPISLALVGLGLVGIGMTTRRRKS